MEIAIKNEAEASLESMKATYNTQRKKRFSSLVAPITKTLIKFSPHLILGAGMVYQAAENHQLEKEIEGVKDKMLTVSKIMLNLTDIEYATVNKELSKVIFQQRQLLMEEQMSNYAAETNALIAKYQIRHQNIANIRTIDELSKSIKDMSYVQ